MAGTDAVHTDDPMTPQAAAELSRQMLDGMGITAKNDADGAVHPGQIPEGANQPAGTEEGAAAAANPDPAQPAGAPDGGDPGHDKNAAWASTLPEEVQADLSRMTPQTVTRLREIAESGLRLDDYTRKTQEVGRDRAKITGLKQKAEFADRVLNDPAMMARLYGAENPAGAPPAGEASPSTNEEIAELMKTADPTEFAQGLDAIIEKRVNSKVTESRASAPETKAATVNSAADRIREAIADKLPEGSWERACEMFVEHCEHKGVQWFDTPVAGLAMELRPHLRLAIAEQIARGRDQPQGDAGGDDGKSTPGTPPGVRAAAMPSSGSGAPPSPFRSTSPRVERSPRTRPTNGR